MTDKTEDKGAGTYGTRHVMEEQMREAEQGVFEAKSNARAPANKARKAAPEDKDALPAVSGMTKAELIDQAAAEGVAVETDDNKADLIAKIEKSRKG